jgi:hypothetical protein
MVMMKYIAAFRLQSLKRKEDDNIKTGPEITIVACWFMRQAFVITAINQFLNRKNQTV